MSELICKINGCRGRSIAVYDNKCVITTDVTLGSILTNNALDGQKTLFYIDVKGVQFKRSGMTIGYLQLETGSVQMNNQSSNMFSENTFTYDQNGAGISNEFMELLHEYIVDRIESYKYGTQPHEEYLHRLISKSSRETGCQVNRSIARQIEEAQKKQEMARQQEAAEKQRQMQEVKEQAAAAFQQALEDGSGNAYINDFFAQACTCSRIAEVQALWQRLPQEALAMMDPLSQKIRDAALLERMYGSQKNSVEKLLTELQTLL